jgi:hypothetical protein
MPMRQGFAQSATNRPARAYRMNAATGLDIETSPGIDQV